MRTRREGFVLAEAIIAGVLLLVALQSAWWVTAVQSSVAARVAEGARLLDEVRLVRHVLGSEVRHGQEGGDWTVDGGELRLRAFRGVGFGCPNQPAAGWGVNRSGHRRPDASKDSVLVLAADGSWRIAALVRTRRNRSLGCPAAAGFESEVWHLEPDPGSGEELVAGFYFERGAYRFSDGAFRYRRVFNWQPLTGTSLAGDSSTLSPRPGGVEAFLAEGAPMSLLPSQRWTVWSRR